jgi:hypothetical protein
MRKFLVIVAILIFMVPLKISMGATNNRKTVITKTTTIWFMNYDAKVPNNWKKTSIASRYNNPGNLRNVRTGKFRRFKTLSDGYMALIRDIGYKQEGKSRYCDSLTTVRDFLYVYAPAFENDTEKYIRHLCNDLDVNPLISIGEIDKYDLARAIIKIEDPVLFSELYVPTTYIDTIYTNEQK